MRVVLSRMVISPDSDGRTRRDRGGLALWATHDRTEPWMSDVTRPGLFSPLDEGADCVVVDRATGQVRRWGGHETSGGHNEMTPECHWKVGPRELSLVEDRCTGDSDVAHCRAAGVAETGTAAEIKIKPPADVDRRVTGAFE